MLDMCIAANYNNQISLEGNCSIFSGRIIVYIGFSCLDRNLQQDVASTSTDLDNLDNTTVITDLSYSYVPPCLEANQERTTNFSIPETSQHNVPHNIVFNNINIECVDTLVLPSTSPSLQKIKKRLKNVDKKTLVLVFVILMTLVNRMYHQIMPQLAAVVNLMMLHLEILLQ